MITSMTELFPACVDVLWERLVPLHYKELTTAALARLGIDRLSAEEFGRAAEDVREKLLEAGNRGTFYIREPHYAGAMLEWFKPKLASEGWLVQGDLFGNVEPPAPHRIDASFRIALDAFTEGLLRFPHMIRKVENADPVRRALGAARGFLIEQHVKDFIHNRWPGLWIDPDNKDLWRVPCSHDFKLKINGTTWSVDVTGPLGDTHFGMPRGGKRLTDIHLFARPTACGDHVELVGYLWGKDFKQRIADGAERIPVESLDPIIRFIVQLNCSQAGVSSGAVRKAVGEYRGVPA